MDEEEEGMPWPRCNWKWRKGIHWKQSHGDDDDDDDDDDASLTDQRICRNLKSIRHIHGHGLLHTAAVGLRRSRDAAESMAFLQAPDLHEQREWRHIDEIY